VPFRENGFTTALQIENFEYERNPYMHFQEDTIAHMNLDYWYEQIKASTAIAASLLIPLGYK
jgi:hypothetical protein